MSEGRRLFLVWTALIALLAISITISLSPLGPLRPLLGYGIAAAKAGLILWFFMDLRRENGLARLAGLAAFAWLALLLLLLASDYVTRGLTGA